MSETINLYETDINRYNKLLTENISTTYRKTNNKACNSINKEAKVIAEEFKIGDRVDCLAKTNTFITLKYHKKKKSKMQTDKYRKEWKLTKLVNYLLKM